MKKSLRVVSLLLLLLAFAAPLSAQNPNVAIKIEASTGNGEYCVGKRYV